MYDIYCDVQTACAVSKLFCFRVKIFATHIVSLGVAFRQTQAAVGGDAGIAVIGVAVTLASVCIAESARNVRQVVCRYSRRQRCTTKNNSYSRNHENG